MVRHLFLSICVVVAGMLVWVTGCSQSGAPGISATGSLDKMRKNKAIVVGYIHYPPSAYRDPDTGEMKGLFVDMLEEIVRSVDPDIQITYEETDWTNFTAALNSGRVDLSIAGTFTTIPRSKMVVFTDPIVYLGRSAIIRESDDRFSPTRGPEQFDRSDVRVGVVEGEGSYEYVMRTFENQDNIVVFSGSDLSQCLAAVAAGQVDVGMSDALETYKFAASHSGVADLYAAAPYDLNPIGWSVRQDDLVWLNFLNNAISYLEASGRIAQWESNYDFQWTHPRRVFAAGR